MIITFTLIIFLFSFNCRFSFLLKLNLLIYQHVIFTNLIIYFIYFLSISNFQSINQLLI